MAAEASRVDEMKGGATVSKNVSKGGDGVVLD